jgi:hypothetical protein
VYERVQLVAGDPEWRRVQLVDSSATEEPRQSCSCGRRADGDDVANERAPACYLLFVSEVMAALIGFGGQPHHAHRFLLW